jgi:hypothetical protein
VSGGQVRDTWFCAAGKSAPGYDARQVDDLLRRVAAELDAGRSARPLIQNATFRSGRYDIDAVDRFLDRFLLPAGHFELDGIADDPWGDLPVTRFAEGNPEYSFYSRCENAWHDFGQVPGTRLWFAKAARGLTELRTAEQQTLASLRRIWNVTFSAGGRSFTLQRPAAAESSSTAVAELLARAARAEAGHYAENTRIPDDLSRGVRGLADETGTPILYTAGNNYNWRACACVLFPDLRWLRFLVRGTRSANAIMTAVDQAGNRVARYRIVDKSGRQREWLRGPVEIIVHPGQRLTNELALALALSADWLASYFDRPGGGG